MIVEYYIHVQLELEEKKWGRAAGITNLLRTRSKVKFIRVRASTERKIGNLFTRGSSGIGRGESRRYV